MFKYLSLVFLVLFFSTKMLASITDANDLEGKIAEAKQTRKKCWLKDKTKELSYLEKEYHIEMALSAWSMGQYDVQSTLKTLGGSVDYALKYMPTTQNIFGLKLEAQESFSSLNSTQFYQDLGSLNVTSAHFEDVNPYFKELWFERKFESFRFRLGVINPDSFMDRSFYNNFTKYFMSQSNSAKSYALLPSSSFALVGSYAKKNFYMNALLCDGNAQSGEAIQNVKDEKMALYSSVELGFTPKKNKYYLNIWSKQTNAYSVQNNKDSLGAFISLNQDLDRKDKVFFKYGASKNTQIRQHMSLGLGHHELFSKKDLFLSSMDFSQSDETSKFQTSVEFVYKYVYENLELSVDLQVIDNLIHSKEDKNFALLPGLRVRALF